MQIKRESTVFCLNKIMLPHFGSCRLGVRTGQCIFNWQWISFWLKKNRFQHFSHCFYSKQMTNTQSLGKNRMLSSTHRFLSKEKLWTNFHFFHTLKIPYFTFYVQLRPIIQMNKAIHQFIINSNEKLRTKFHKWWIIVPFVIKKIQKSCFRGYGRDKFWTKIINFKTAISDSIHSDILIIEF